MLCRESAQAAHQATEAQEAMDQHYKAKWRQAQADLQTLCQSNRAQVQSLASKLQETSVRIPVQFGPSPLTQNIAVLVHAVYLQLNGEITMLENSEKKNANCLTMCLQNMKRIL